MKRLLCIIDSLNVGGAETFLMKVLRCLPADEYQFDFVVSQAHGVYATEILERGGKIYVVPPRRKDLLGALRDIRAIVKQNNYEKILKLGDEPVVGVDLIAAKMGGARQTAFRSCNALTGLSLKSKIINAAMRPVLNGITDIRIAPSVLAAEFTFGKRCARRAKILHNGVNLRKFQYDIEGRELIRQEFNIKDKFVVGHIGRFNRQKNHGYLLKVFFEITRLREDAVLLLVGTGDDRELVFTWIRDLKLEDKVIMVGQRFDIPQLLSAMDVFVFPSLHEGMPNTVIEAQATGLPCVISDTITREADITGLVRYLPLTSSPFEWAKCSLEVAALPRKNTTSDFQVHGYDIERIAEEFISLVGMTD